MEHLFGALLGGVTTAAFAQQLADASGSSPKLILDLRSLPEFEQGHVPGARHMELEQLNNGITVLVADKTSSIAVYCGTGATATLAARQLRAMGYFNVENAGSFTHAQLRFSVSLH